jgi:hypothetical protein
MRNLSRVVLPLLALALAGVALAQGVEPDVWRDTVLPSIFAGLASVAIAAIGWAATKASVWFEARATEAKGSIVNNALSLTYTLAGVTVQHLAQTVTDKLRAASADGKLDPRDAADVLKAAVYEVWQGLGANAREVLLQQYGTFDKVVDAVIRPTIEAKVHEAKILTPVSEPPIQNQAEALRELQHARERLRAITAITT